MKNRILVLETSDFETFPIGGQLTFVRNLIKIMGPQLALAGVVADDSPVGQWFEKKINGHLIPFFAYMRIPSAMVDKPLIPYRLQTYVALKRYINRIKKIGAGDIFIQCPEIMMSVSNCGWDSICFRFPGVQDEMKYSRYFWARYLSRPFNYMLQKSLQNADLILASASREAINEVIGKSKGRLEKNKIVSFPTRVDTEVFRPIEKDECRKKLSIPPNDLVLITCTRLAWSKGWELVFEAFMQLRKSYSEARLIFVGDGEDRSKLEAKIKQFEMDHYIFITGAVEKKKVPIYLNAADVYIVGSYREGWSNSMLEALACAKPIVSTRVSGAEQMISEGENGFIVNSRDPLEFSRAVLKSRELSEAGRVSLRIANKYALKNLKEDLTELWEPMCKLGTDFDSLDVERKASLVC